MTRNVYPRRLVGGGLSTLLGPGSVVGAGACWLSASTCRAPSLHLYGSVEPRTEPGHQRGEVLVAAWMKATRQPREALPTLDPEPVGGQEADRKRDGARESRAR